MFKNSEHKKSFVEDELSDLAAVEAAGIDLPLEEARTVLMLWSRVISHGHGKTRSLPYSAASFIGLVVNTRVPRPAGDSLAPLISAADARPIPDGQTALRRLGIDSADISAEWEQSATFPTSCLPLSLVLAFLPAAAWPIVAAFIGCSADERAPRIDEALRQHGRRAGPAPLRNDLTCLSLVMRTLITLNQVLHAENEGRSRRGAPPLELPAELATWTALPQLPSPRELAAKGTGGRGGRNTAAVPTERIRQALADHTRSAGWGRWRPGDWPLNRNWRALKELGVLCLLVTACPRVDHLRLLDIDDFDPMHTFEDGSIGPGLCFRRSAMKNGGASGDSYWKRLPDVVGDVLTAWITCSGREIGQADAPLLISTCIKEPGDPGQRYAGGSSLSKFVSGLGPRRRPIVPLPGQEWRGYTPHQFRSTLTQTVERRFASWRLDNPSHPLAAYDPRVVGELAIDHKINDLGYRDYTDRRRLEQILALAITLAWQECWGEGLRRLGLDPEAIVAARDAVLLLEAELTMTSQLVTTLEAEHADVSQRARTAHSDHDRLRILVDAQAIAGQLQTKLRRQLNLADDLAKAKTTLEQARTTRVILPDDLDNEQYEQKLADALTDHPTNQNNLGPPVAAPLANELIPADLAELFGVSEMTIRRWRAGASSSPIDPTAWTKINEHDYRYPVSALDQLALSRIPATDPDAALDRIRRNRAALGYGHRHNPPKPDALPSAD